MSARPAIQSHHRGRYRKGIYYHRALRSPVEKKKTPEQQMTQWGRANKHKAAGGGTSIKQRWNTHKLFTTKGNLHTHTELDLHKLLSTTKKMKLVHQKITFKNLFHF